MELRWSYDGTSMGLRRIWVFFRYLPAIATARPSAVLCPVPVSGILSPMAASVLGVLGYGPGRIDFPAAAQGFVDGDEAGGGAGFGLGQLGLDRELGALGIEHVGLLAAGPESVEEIKTRVTAAGLQIIADGPEGPGVEDGF